MRTFILTLDYELYGDGSGDVFDLMIKPAERLLSIAEEHEIKYTFFFEAVAYWKLKEAWQSGNRMGYAVNPIDAIEKQVSDMIRRGHDIQLHLHPQWLDAEYCEGIWRVDGSNWRLGDYRPTCGLTLFDLIRRGKRTLETLIKPVNPTYQCIALRAGGYNAQPSSHIIQAMEQCGMRVDSSLYAGGVEYGPLSEYDYSDLPADAYWNVGKELTERGMAQVIELPVYSAPIPRWKKYTSLNLWLSFLKKRHYPCHIPSMNGGQEIRHGKMPEKIWQTWDFCLLSPRMQSVFLKRMEAERRDIAVLVGHPKCFIRRNSLDKLLKLTRKDKYITITDFLQSC